MTRMPWPLAFAGIAIAVLASQALAATYDVPTLELVKVGRAKIGVQVVAGPSGAPAGFTIEWMTQSDYSAAGGWPTDASDPRSSQVHRATFAGTPTLNTTDGTTTFLLLPLTDAGTEIGDLFDETGVTGDAAELAPGMGYVVRACANGDATNSASPDTPDFVTSTAAPTQLDCTFTQGYWKNHPEAWPAASVTLGTVSYTQTQLLQILAQPAKGNGLVSLAHQLIAAKLNVANGVVPPPAVATTITQADALIGGLVCPPIGSGFIASTLTDPLTSVLDDFNNGITGPGHCDSTPAHPTTWGRLKAMYR